MSGPEKEPPVDGRNAARWLALVAAGAAFVWVLGLLLPSPTDPSKVDYAVFLARANADGVTSVEIHQTSGEVEGIWTSGDVFTAQGPPGGLPDADLAVLDAHGVARSYAKQGSDLFGSLLVFLLPVALIVGVLVWSSNRTTRRITGSGFTRSNARLHRSDRPDVTFDDVAGYDSVKQEIVEVVDFLRDSSKFKAIGARIPKGMLLVGPPGTGKTLLARAVAGEAEVPFFSITGSEFLEMFVGVGAARVRDLFATARKQTPAILFVDELDAIGRKRGTGVGGGSDEREQTLNQLLAEMDGFDSTEGIVVLAATNRPDVLDPALLRAGRFDRQVVIPLPTAVERLAILEVHAGTKKLADDVDLELVARGTAGMSGADLANLLNEASLIAVRRNGTSVSASDLDAARDRVLLGQRRSSLVLAPDEKRTIACHEAGHTTLAELLPHADRVHKVTILPAGFALGATEQLAAEERQLRTVPQLEDTLAVLLGGRVAEELALGSTTTGSHDDLVSATGLARRMVREWGMSDRLGHMAWGSQGPVFLGEDLVQTRDYSDQTARIVDEEVARILDEQIARATELLGRHRPLLDALVDALLDHETLDAAEIERITAAAASPRSVTSSPAGAGTNGY